MARSLLVLALLGVIALALLAMASSWRRRIAAGSDIPHLLVAPTPLSEAALRIDHSTYLGTVTPAHWLDKVAAQGLGSRGPAATVVEKRGLIVERVGTDALFIPQESITNVELARGLAGRVYGKEGVLIVHWTWGAQSLQTGLRIPDGQARADVISALAQLRSGHLWSDINRSTVAQGEG